jgi:hypothetical protein
MWKSWDKFGNFLKMELQPNEWFARITPVTLVGHKGLFFDVSRLSRLKECLGELIRKMRVRTCLHSSFNSDMVKVIRCTEEKNKAPLVLLSFRKSPPQSWVSLKEVVKLRRDISDIFIEIKLSQKASNG